MNVRNIILKTLKKLKSKYKYRKIYVSKVKHDISMAYYSAIKPDVDVTDKAEVDFFLSTLPSGYDVFFDLGANAGYFSALASLKSSIPSIISVEPNCQNFTLLLRTIAENNAERILPLNLAVSDQYGVVNLYGASQGASLFKNWGGREQFSSGLVARVRLDDFVLEMCRGKSILMKCDIEGNEYYALKGALQLIKNSEKMTVILEHGLYKNYSHKNLNYLELFKLFEGLNFLMFNLNDLDHQLSVADIEKKIDDLTGKNEPFKSLTFVFMRGDI